jgi:hypothetical protein
VRIAKQGNQHIGDEIATLLVDMHRSDGHARRVLPALSKPLAAKNCSFRFAPIPLKNSDALV